MKNIFIGIISIVTISVFIYHKIDYHFLNPINQNKMPNDLSELKNLIKENINNLTQDLPKPIDERSYYKPSVNLISEFRRFPYNKDNLSIIIGNIPKNKAVQKLQNKSDVIISYCNYNIHTKIKRHHIDDKEFIDIYVEFEDRGDCMH